MIERYALSGGRQKSKSGPVDRPLRLVDKLVEELQRAIVEGEYPVGARLPSEMALGSRYGVGRSTVREALRVLTHLGQISTRTGSGSVVVDITGRLPLAGAEMTIDEMSSIYTFRYSLEISAVQIAATRRTVQQMRSMKRYIRAIKESVNEGDLGAACSADLDFHTTILIAADYDFAARVYAENRARFELALKTLIALGGPLEPSDNGDWGEHLHDKLVDSMERKDAKGAVRILRRDQDEVQIRLNFARRNAEARLLAISPGGVSARPCLVARGC